MKLHYAGYQPNASGFGWATCNNAMVREIGKHCELVSEGADVVFMPLVNHDLAPATHARGKVNLAYTFFEFELGANAVANAAKYDVVFAGSTWCLERLAERGIRNTALLVQGVDSSVFSPQAPREKDGKFRIFSGGKFEWRKGQDLVTKAFCQFEKMHADAELVCAWWNPWPELAHGAMRAAELTEQDFSGFTLLPRLGQHDLALEMANTDVGLFPNRCEGGTNLVMMEYAALNRKVISNKMTGHADVSEIVTFEIQSKRDGMGWASSSIGQIVEAIEAAYIFRDAEFIGQPKARTWEDAAQIVLQAASHALKEKRGK